MLCVHFLPMTFTIRGELDFKSESLLLLYELTKSVGLEDVAHALKAFPRYCISQSEPKAVTLSSPSYSSLDGIVLDL